MDSRMRNGAMLCMVLALCAFYWLTGRNDGRAPDQATCFVGTWTDENGPPGNYVLFSQVHRPSAVPGIQLIEGHGRIHGLLGENDTPIIWNYESHTPLRLNVVIRNRTLVVPVQLADKQHLHLRFVPTADVARWTNQVWDGPDVVRLTRTKDAAEEP